MPIKPEVKVTVKKHKANKYRLDESYLEMTTQEIKKYARRYFDMANKRIRRQRSQELFSPALRSVMTVSVNGHKGEFYVKGLSLKEIQSELVRCFNFLGMKTSTVTGAKQYERTLEARFNQGKKFSQAQHRAIWEVYRAVRKINPNMAKVYGSDRLIQYIANDISAADDELMRDDGTLDLEAFIENANNEIRKFHEKVIEDAFKEFDVLENLN